MSTNNTKNQQLQLHEIDDILDEIEQHEEKNNSKVTPSGLINQLHPVGCYFNGFIQSLFMTPEFRRAVLQWQTNSKIESEKSFPLQLQKLFARLQLGTEPVDTRMLTKSVGWNENSLRQKDVQELCFNILDFIRKASGNQLPTIVAEFEGKQNNSILCTKCNNEILRPEAFLGLGLAIQKCDTFDASINDYLSHDTIDGYHCKKCKSAQTALMSKKLTNNMPYILNIFVKRHVFSMTTYRMEKLDKDFTFPIKFNAKKYINSADAKERIYELYTIIMHTGDDGTGKYFNYTKDFTSTKWFCFQNDKVTEIPQSTVNGWFSDDLTADDGFVHPKKGVVALMYRVMDSVKNINSVSNNVINKTIKQEIVEEIQSGALAAPKMETEEVLEALFRAIHRGKYGEFEELMNEYGDTLDPNAEVQNEPLLHVTIKYDRYKMADYLLKKYKSKISVNKYNKGGCTPLHYACNFASTQMVKLLVLQKGIDINAWDRTDIRNTAIHMAIVHNRDDVVELLVANGASLYKANGNKENPIRKAQKNGSWGIALSLRLCQLNESGNRGVSVRQEQDRIESCYEVANQMEKLYRNCNDLTPEQLKGFLVTTKWIITQNIKNRQPIDQPLLYLLWKLSKWNEKKALLDEILAVCDKILEPPINKIDWIWLNSFLLKNPLWLDNTPQQQDDYEREKKEKEAKELLNDNAKRGTHWNFAMGNLTKIMRQMRPDAYSALLNIVDKKNEKEKDFMRDTLSKYTIKEENEVKENEIFSQIRTVKTTDLSNKLSKDIRQDIIDAPDILPNPIECQIDNKELQQLSKQTFKNFDPKIFYNTSIYLNDLMFRSNIINNKFQQCIRHVFEQWNNGLNSDKYVISAGPIKGAERVKQKTETKYKLESFPSCAKVLDFVRCSITFYEPDEMVKAINFFVKYVEEGKNNYDENEYGRFVQIVRVKNLFIENKFNISKPEYADIKINIVYDFNGKSMIVELQFLLKEILNAKKRIHEFYSLKRRKEFYKYLKESIISIDPKERFFACIMNKDVNDSYNMRMVCLLIISHGYNAATKADSSSNWALFNACKAGNIKIVNLLLSERITPKNIVEKIINDKDVFGFSALSVACEFGNPKVVEELLKIKGINKNIIDSYGDTVMMTTIKNCRDMVNGGKVLEILIKNGIELPYDALLITCQQNKLPFMKAVIKCKNIIGVDKLKKLLKQSDKYGYSPVHFARYFQFDEMIKMCESILVNKQKIKVEKVKKDINYYWAKNGLDIVIDSIKSISYLKKIGFTSQMNCVQMIAEYSHICIMEPRNDKYFKEEMVYISDENKNENNIVVNYKIDGKKENYSSIYMQGIGSIVCRCDLIQSDYMFFKPQCHGSLVYFEITFIKNKKVNLCDNLIGALGYTPGKDFPESTNYKVKNHKKVQGGCIGWQPNCIGMHSDDGGIYYGSSFSHTKIKGKPYGKGDIIGCGVDFKNKTIFYTKNGTIIKGIFDAKEWIQKNLDKKLGFAPSFMFFTIWDYVSRNGNSVINEMCSFEWNFGLKKFAYDIVNHKTDQKVFCHLSV